MKLCDCNFYRSIVEAIIFIFKKLNLKLFFDKDKTASLIIYCLVSEIGLDSSL